MVSEKAICGIYRSGLFCVATADEPTRDLFAIGV